MVLVVAVLRMWASLSSRCSWPWGSRGAEGEVEGGVDVAPHGVQVEGGPPPLPPTAEEGGEEGLHLGQVGVDEHVGVGHGGGEAAPTRAILVVVTLKRGRAWRVAAAAREDEDLTYPLQNVS